ncbi:hypothetical protein CNEO2_1030006 [Clostridium neonatale]|nr:hypothetical protein CNEO2_1030006 [Clostridium neonatale]CAI3564305.1 hypothetical protein CNEO3_130002 [Clostridium neonatale]
MDVYDFREKQRNSIYECSTHIRSLSKRFTPNARFGFSAYA